jgi:hypothetical protein
MTYRLTESQLRELGGVLHLTRPDELTCDEWLDAIGRYAEALAADMPAPPGSELVEHHLAICPECREEMDALVAALRPSSAGP